MVIPLDYQLPSVVLLSCVVKNGFWNPTAQGGALSNFTTIVTVSFKHAGPALKTYEQFVGF